MDSHLPLQAHRVQHLFAVKHHGSLAPYMKHTSEYHKISCTLFISQPTRATPLQSFITHIIKMSRWWRLKAHL